MKTPKELKARFPYMFREDRCEIGIAKGWFQTFVKLCHDIDALLGEDKQGFYWVQVREKFGTARFYWDLGAVRSPLRIDIQMPTGILSYETDPDGGAKDGGSNRLMEQISALGHAAEIATQKFCAVCGEPGAMDDTDGYLLTLCQMHAAQRKALPIVPLDLWFGPGGDLS